MRCGKVQRITGGHVGIHAYLKFAVVALQRGGTGAALDRCDIFQTHLPNLRGRNHHACKHVGIVALLGQQLHRDRILFRALFEARDFIFAGIEQPHGIAYVRHANADIRCALAIHFHLQLRGVEVETRIDIHEFGILRHAVGGSLADFRELRQLRAANHGGDGKINLAAEHGGQTHVVRHVVMCRQYFANLGGRLHVSLFPFASRYQHNKKMRMVRGTVREGLHQRHFGQRDDTFGNFRGQLCRFLQRRALRKRVRADQLGLVIGRNPVSPDQTIEAER